MTFTSYSTVIKSLLIRLSAAILASIFCLIQTEAHAYFALVQSHTLPPIVSAAKTSLAKTFDAKLMQAALAPMKDSRTEIPSSVSAVFNPLNHMGNFYKSTLYYDEKG